MSLESLERSAPSILLAGVCTPMYGESLVSTQMLPKKSDMCIKQRRRMLAAAQMVRKIADVNYRRNHDFLT